jgi:phenylpropionate dioxygenase-like ring-hydroxylating dioxygenase large terminal subunit
MVFLRNCWYAAAWEYELAPDKPLGRQIIGEPIVLFRTQSGPIRALTNRCAHRRVPLSMGRIEGDNLRCMYHGLLFAPDGHCLQVPGSTMIPPNSTVRSFPVLVQDDWIWVWMGDPEKADPALVPQAFGLKDPRWTMRSGQMNYRAHYMLINDNLCDLSHVDFVHERTLGLATGGGWSEHVPKITPRERGVRIERWLVAKPASPTNSTLVDTWSTYNYEVPGVFVMENRSYPHGMAEKVQFQTPTAEPMTHRVEQQAVTPVSATETRYFFATGIESRIPPRLIDAFFSVVMAAFTEDHEMIEAQQRMWDITPPDQPMAFIAHDKGPSMFRRIITRLITAERNGSHGEAPAATAPVT